MALNVNMESLTKMYGSEAKALGVFREIADLGGYGDIGTGQGQVNPYYQGGLGILGALKEENTAISSRAKDRIAELAQVDRKKDVDKHKGVGLPRTASKQTEEDK